MNVAALKQEFIFIHSVFLKVAFCVQYFLCQCKNQQQIFVMYKSVLSVKLLRVKICDYS